MKRLVAFLLALAVTIVPARAQYQQGQPLSALPQATLPLSGNELLYVFQKGQSRQAPVTSVSPPNVSFPATGNGAISSAPSSQRFGHVANVIDDFGAPANTATIPGTCSIASGSFTLTCPSANFVAGTGGCTGDVCKYIMVHGAGASGAALQTTIAAVVNSTTVTLGNSASTAVPSSALLALSISTIQSGSGSYIPGDTINLTANQGTTTTAAQLLVLSTQVASVAPSTNGSGCSDNTYTVSGNGGGRPTTAQFTATIVISGGVVTSATLLTGGGYLLNPGTLASVSVFGAGCSVTQPTLAVKMGPLTWKFLNAGLFSGTLPTSFTQASSSGSGTGAAFNVTTWYANGQYTLYGSDDTAAIVAAAAAAQANDVPLYLPAGNYWMASATASVNLTDVTVFGIGGHASLQPFTNTGSMLFISNASTSAFVLGSGVTISDLGVDYPAQDGSSPTPVTFPALFEVTSTGTGTVKQHFNNLNLINPYIMYYQSPTDIGIGGIFFHGIDAYCVFRCLDIESGAPDTVQINSITRFTPATFLNFATSGPGGYLETYTAANGEVVYIDTSYAAAGQGVTGLMLQGGFTYGYAYGIRVRSANNPATNANTSLGVSDVTGWHFDGVGTALSVEDRACASNISVAGGQMYGYAPILAPTITPNGINLNTSCSVNGTLTFSGFFIGQAQGDGVYIAPGTGLVLNWTGGAINNWGQSSTQNNYGAIHIDSSSSEVSLSGATLTEIQPPGNGDYCINGQSVAIFTMSGTTCRGAYSVGVFIGAATATLINLNGNSSFATTNAGPTNDVTSSGQFYDRSTNLWDNPVKPTLTSGWGTSPTLASWSTNNSFSVTVGSGGGSNPVLTYGLGFGNNGSGIQPHPKICQATDVTSGTALGVAASSITAVTFSGSMSASDVVQGTCSF